MTESGGKHNWRGLKFQTAALLNYILARMADTKCKLVKVELEGKQDATLYYASRSRASEIVELVQCKKREDQRSPNPGVLPGSDWSAGDWNPGSLGSWIKKKAGPLRVCAALEDPNHRFTVWFMAA